MIRINAKAIGIKTPIKVNESIKKVKETFKFQAKVLKQGQPKGKNQIDRVVHYYDSQVKAIGEMVNYVADMLDLNDKQIKRMENTEFPKLTQLSNQIVVKMLHYDDNDDSQKKGKK